MLPNVVLGAETDELGLTAGLQDRVVQSYEGLVYMDFDRKFMDENGYGRYERLDHAVLPPLYVAYRTDLSQESSDAHIRVRDRYDKGDQEVVDTMNRIAALADEAREAIEAHNPHELAQIMDRNFDLRASIYPISDENREMVERARSAGASCKFCSSGGAVVGTWDDDGMLEKLRSTMQEGGYEFLVPDLVGPRPKQQ